MEPSLKAMFVKPRFIMRVFIVEMKGPRDFFDILRNLLKRGFTVHCSL